MLLRSCAGRIGIAEHFEPLLGYEPPTQWMLCRIEGGPRFLEARPVHATATLELLLDDGHRHRVR